MNRLTVLSLSTLAVCFAEAAAPVAPAAFEPFKPGEVTVGGEIGRRMEITAAKLMRTDIEQTFVRHFRTRKETPEAWGGFAGWGMTLDAIVKAAAHGVGGEKFRRFKDHWVAETLGVQSADGAISMFSGKPGIWDNHEQAYLLQALALDHRHFGNADALAGARRLADYLIRRKSTVNLGLETGFLLVAAETGDRRYADYCRDCFATTGDNDAYDRALPVNGVLHVYTWIQRVLAQMQYRALTKCDTPTLHAAEDELFRRAFVDYSSVSGSMSGGPRWGEVWDISQIGLGRWGETCVSAYLLRATAARMAEHPETRYGDLYERVMYNAFFGAQSQDGEKQRYFIPFDESGEWFEHETYCCPNNLRRMMFELPDAVFFRTADGVALNLFTPAELKTKGLAVSVKTDYPQDGHVSVRVTAKRPGVLRVRVPKWTNLPDVGAWRALAYGAGSADFAVDFPMDVRLVRGRAAQVSRVAVLRGPVVYAVAKRKGWAGNMDAFALDTDAPMTWKGGGVAVTLVDRRRQARHEETLVPFCSESRERTYLPVVGNGATVDDELYAGGR